MSEDKTTPKSAPKPASPQKTDPPPPVRKTRRKKVREKSVLREYFELIVETAVFVFFVMTFVVQAFQIPTGSMESTLLIGAFLLVNKFAYAAPRSALEDAVLPNRPIRRHDIVVFKYPQELNKDYVKRVVALEGEKVEIRDKQVYVNDQPVAEPFKVHRDSQLYTKSEYYQYDDLIRDNYGPVTVPPGHMFMMGDNRDYSWDSRYWGFLPLSYVKGRPWLIYFSYAAERNAYLQTSVGERLKKLATFLPKARWRRMLKIIR
ncbi:MAG: signal peptidase I [Candidatus Aminicenantes bacterium]|nr:signal peptidase I [Candidatus Aminicenantes bacterium]